MGKKVIHLLCSESDRPALQPVLDELQAKGLRLSEKAPGKNDLVLYFSFSGSIRELVEVGQLVRKTEAKLILVTRYESSPGADYADLVLVCGANESPHQQGSIAVKLGNLFIIDILFNEFCSRNLDVVTRNKQITQEASIPMFVTKD